MTCDTRDLSRVALGRWGERRAADAYRRRGYRLVDTNWHGSRGELDLVLAAPDGVVVFCEVKARRHEAFGSPLAAVDHRKQRRLRQTAVEWLRAHQCHGEVRFDVAAVTGTRVEIVESAF